MAQSRVLVADDDDKIRELLELYLTKEGFAVEQAADGAEAILKAQQLKPDLIVLDIMMPVLDGMETCRQIRKLATTPILLLTARTEVDDKLLGFDCGADDYVEKPFNPQEVVARVRAILRRRSASSTSFKPIKPPTMIPTVQHGTLLINPAARTVNLDGAEKELTAKEFDLLHALASRPGHVFSREHLLQTVWGIDNTGDSRTVDIHIQRLRQKLGDDSGPGWKIATVWGVGYRFEINSSKESRS